MKLLSCDLCDEAFAAETFEDWMQLMMPHYMVALIVLTAVAVFLYWQKYKDVYEDTGRLQVSQKGDAVDVINQMKQTHMVETTVGEGANCLSMCVPIYLQGEQRSASRNSRWMFHEPSAYDYITDEKVEETDADRNAASDRFFERYFVNSEMDAQWRDNLQKEWVGKDVWRTGSQLYEERSNVILGLY